ncbi:N-acetylmuramoyl-L-alanine amidase [Escherichia coli]|nr:N-acetylmuramoyl-L-alanine amidase [Salmonella enterica subsp. enterica serovar Virchow]EFG2886014.1 N-acetylmuramoyl-L-alanine amidase [Escherichia coli]
MTTVLELQRALLARGFDIGKAGADGLIGPATLNAVLQSLANDPIKGGSIPTPSPRPEPLPADWLPWAQMQRIIVHWTGGAHKASADDRKHYHVLIEGDGTLTRGIPAITLNQSPVKAGYAAHTLNCNGGSIAVSLAAMGGAIESPFNSGKYPVTRAQWEALMPALAQLARRYAIPVTDATILSHAEVQATLGIKQRGKWDIARLPFDPTLNSAKKIGDAMRAAVKALL